MAGRARRRLRRTVGPRRMVATERGQSPGFLTPPDNPEERHTSPTRGGERFTGASPRGRRGL